MGQKQTTTNDTMRGYEWGNNRGWKELQEEQAWDDFLAWCRAQENGPHE